MNKYMIALILTIILWFSLSCDITEVAEDCNIVELVEQDSISVDCRTSIQDLLYPSENNLSNNIVKMGLGEIEGKPLLFFTGSNESGSPLILDSSDIIIIGTQNDEKDTLDIADYEMKNFKDISGTIISLSSIIDYSGSMLNSDIDDAVEIYTDIFGVFNPVFESEIKLFSDTVYQKSAFISDYNLLINKISRDNSIERKSTSLYDAIGGGLSALSNRNGLIKLLLVATDGRENSSETFTSKSQIYNLSKQQNIPVIILGSLFADLDFMRELAEETNGYYIYNKAFLNLKSDVIGLIQILTNIQAIEITGEDWTNATSFQVTIDGKTLVFNLD